MSLVSTYSKHLFLHENAGLDFVKSSHYLLNVIKTPLNQQVEGIEYIIGSFSFFETIRRHPLFLKFFYIFNDGESASRVVNKLFINLMASHNDKCFRKIFLAIFEAVNLLYTNLKIVSILKDDIPSINIVEERLKNIENELENMSDDDFVALIDELISGLKKKYPSITTYNEECEKENGENRLGEDFSQNDDNTEQVI